MVYFSFPHSSVVFVTKPTKPFDKAGESGQLACFPAAMRLRAATRFSLVFIIVLQVLYVL